MFGYNPNFNPFDPTGDSLEYPSAGNPRMAMALALSTLSGVNTPGFGQGVQNAMLMGMRQRRLDQARRDKLDALTRPQVMEIGDSLVEVAPMYKKERGRLVRIADQPQVRELYQEPAEAAGAFAGTGIENQMLNILLDPTIPESDPRKILARQRLSRETTVTTPEGTYTRGAYNLGALHEQPGGEFDPTGGAPQGDFHQRNPTQREQTAQYTVSQMRGLDATASDFVPKFHESFLDDITPSSVSGLFLSDEYKNYRDTASQWTTAKVFLQSGATARADEIERDFRDLWPQPGDSDQVVERKNRQRQEAMDNAEQAYLARVGQPPGASTDTAVEWWVNPQTGKLEPKP